MTKPKSRSIFTSLAISTAKPGVAVTAGGEDGGAGARVGGAQRLGDRQPAPRSSWKRAERMTLNSVAIAIVSAPSAADIGLSGIWLSQSTSADQPLASSTGTSGTSARATER